MSTDYASINVFPHYYEHGGGGGFEHNPQLPGVISDGKSPSHRPWEIHEHDLAVVLKG